jgi:hypothetical protein
MAMPSSSQEQATQGADIVQKVHAGWQVKSSIHALREMLHELQNIGRKARIILQPLKQVDRAAGALDRAAPRKVLTGEDACGAPGTDPGAPLVAAAARLPRLVHLMLNFDVPIHGWANVPHYNGPSPTAFFSRGPRRTSTAHSKSKAV